MSTIRRVARNTVVLLFAQFISYLLAFFYTIYMARYLGPEEYGIIALAIAVTAIYSILIDFGIQQFLVKDIAGDRDLAGRHIINACAIKVVLAVVAYGLMAITINLLGYTQSAIIIIYTLGIATVVNSFSQTFLSFSWALEKMEYLAGGQIIGALALTLGIVLAVQTGQDVMVFSLIYVAANLIVMIYSLLALRWVLGKNKTNIGKNVFKLDMQNYLIILKQVWPIGLILLMGTIRLKSDTIILSLWSGEQAVGLYNAAYRFVDVAVLIPAMLMTSLFPVMSYYHKHSIDKYKMACTKAAKFLLILALPIAVYVDFFSSQIISLTFGQQYHGSVLALNILIWGGSVMYLGSLVGTMFITSGNQVRGMIVAAVMLVTNLALNLILIPVIGYIGASIALLITEVFGLTASVMLLHGLGYKLNILEIVKAPVVATVVVVAVLALAGYLQFNLMLAGIVGLIIYILLIIRIGIRKDDLLLMRELIDIDDRVKLTD